MRFAWLRSFPWYDMSSWTHHHNLQKIHHKFSHPVQTAMLIALLLYNLNSPAPSHTKPIAILITQGLWSLSRIYAFLVDNALYAAKSDPQSPHINVIRLNIDLSAPYSPLSYCLPSHLPYSNQNRRPSIPNRMWTPMLTAHEKHLNG